MTGDPRHVLVVDDDDDIRFIAERALTRVAGWRVSTATDGTEALASMAAECPDAVVMDVTMPNLDGPATWARIQADPALADVPVVLLTARARTAERAELLRLGVAGVLVKPFDPMALHHDISEAVGWA